MNTDVPSPIWSIALRLRESSSDFSQRMKDMLAGAERVLTEIRARAVRLSRLPPSQSDPVRLARGRIGQCVVGPHLLTVERREPHFLGPGALCSLRERLRDQRLLAHGFSWGPRGWRSGQSQRELLFQNQREGRPGVLTRHLARVAAPFKTMAGGRTQSQRDRRAVQSQPKHVPIEFDLSGKVNVEFAARDDEAVTLGAEQLRDRKSVV